MQEEFLGEQMLENALQEFTLQRCPTCRYVIDKIDGCNHVKCTNCKAEFCWVCHLLKGEVGIPDRCQWNHPTHNSH